MNSSSSSSLTLAVLGAGNMGTRLGKSFLQIPGVSIRYVFSRRISAAQALAQQLGATALDRMDKIWADPSVNAVVLCLPTFTRWETLAAAVQSRKHIFCEKPLALNPAMAGKIATLLEGYDRCVMVGHVLRFFWEYSRLHQKVQAGEIGRIGTVRLSRCVGYPGAESWFADPNQSGGVVLDLLIHDIDFLLWTFGDVAQVYARSLTGRQVGCLDYALLNIQMQSGVIAHLEGSWAHPPGSFRQTVEICGSKGMLSFDSRACPSLEWLPTEKQNAAASLITVPEAEAGSDPYHAEVRHFVDCISDQRSPSIDWRDALRACNVAFQAMESASQGVPISCA